jgi:hypothetical protein
MGRFFAVAAVVASACEPGWHVQGHVRDAGAGVVRGADVALSCPGQQDLAATTDRGGAFQLRGRGPGPSLGCAVVVASPAYAPVRVPLATVCGEADGAQERCAVASIDTELRRR